VGLPVLICDTDKIKNGDELEVDLEKGTVVNKITGDVLKFAPLPKAMIRILNDGGLLAHIQKYGDFKID